MPGELQDSFGVEHAEWDARSVHALDPNPRKKARGIMQAGQAVSVTFPVALSGNDVTL